MSLISLMGSPRGGSCVRARLGSPLATPMESLRNGSELRGLRAISPAHNACGNRRDGARFKGRGFRRNGYILAVSVGTAQRQGEQVSCNPCKPRNRQCSWVLCRSKRFFTGCHWLLATTIVGILPPWQVVGI